MHRNINATNREAIMQAAVGYLERGWSLIPIPAGKKKATISWGRYRKKRADLPQLKKWFLATDSNVAAIMGGPSSDLICRDYDDEGEYQLCATEFPHLAESLPTAKTARGFHVYATASLEHVAEVRQSIGKPQGTGGVKVRGGELRAGVGCYVVLPPSVHPSGHRYKWIVPLSAEKPPEIDIFRAHFYIPPTDDSSSFTQSDTERHKRTQDYTGLTQENTGLTQAIERGLEEKNNCWSEEIQEAIISTIPTGPGERHRQVFELGRSLKGIPELADVEAKQLKPYVKVWYEMSVRFIATKVWSETWKDFKACWPRIKIAKGESLMKMLVDSLELQPLPVAADEYDDCDELLQLVALCRELQKVSGDKPFFLSCRVAGETFGVSHVRAATWLSILVDDEILVVVEKGHLAGGSGGNLATSYYYLGPLT